MPYTFSWYDDDHTIGHLDMHGTVSWQEWNEAVDNLADELAKVQYRLDFIFNDRAGLPPGNPLPHLKATMKKLSLYPNMGIVVMVSKRSIATLVGAFVNIVATATKTDLNCNGGFVNTVEEALIVIAKNRTQHKVTL
ncbi:MAG: hypothetical protein H0X30_08630 [Anaerolineae bacterium]|nr:hypothetical protein [Anaerolineae bacterium]